MEKKIITSIYIWENWKSGDLSTIHASPLEVDLQARRTLSLDSCFCSFLMLQSTISLACHLLTSSSVFRSSSHKPDNSHVFSGPVPLPSICPSSFHLFMSSHLCEEASWPPPFRCQSIWKIFWLPLPWLRPRKDRKDIKDHFRNSCTVICPDVLRQPTWLDYLCPIIHFIYQKTSKYANHARSISHSNI